ncbi:MAG: hypothetical protein ACKO3T_01840 [Planctomycetaceae bacterium]
MGGVFEIATKSHARRWSLSGLEQWNVVAGLPLPGFGRTRRRWQA